MLRQKAGAGLEIFSLLLRGGLNRYRGPNRVAIAFRSTQAEGNRVAKVFHYVVRNPELRCVTIL